MRKLKLTLKVELDIVNGITDEEVYEAICNHFVGKDGEGLRSVSGKRVIAPTHDLEIFNNPEWPSSVWGSSQ